MSACQLESVVVTTQTGKKQSVLSFLMPPVKQWVVNEQKDTQI